MVCSAIGHPTEFTFVQCLQRCRFYQLWDRGRNSKYLLLLYYYNDVMQIPQSYLTVFS